MDKLYYGDGSCTIFSSDAKGIEIRFRGNVEITDKTPDGYALAHQGNGILIFPIGITNEPLSDLFDYVGELRITSVIVANSQAEKVPTTIQRVMDYAELLNTNAEDMTTNSEDLSNTYVSGRKVAKTSLKQPNINNLSTSNQDGSLHYEDGTIYEGFYHIHLSNNMAMTGREHSEDSVELYFPNGKPTKNPKLVPYGAIEQKKQAKKNKAISTRNRGKY